MKVVMPFPPNTGYPDDGDRVQAVTRAVSHVAVALDELKDQLENTNRRVDEVAGAQITEAELGRLFVRSARFADSTIAGAQEEARQLVADARRESERILNNARVDADTIIEEATRSLTLPPAAFAIQVQAALDGFTRVNADFLTELEFLRDSLRPLLTASTPTAMAEVGGLTEAPAVTSSSTTPVDDAPPEVPDLPATTSAGPDVISLESLLASAWHPAPAASPQPGPHVPRSRRDARKRLRGNPT
jgi:hypothetical protein